MREWRVSEKPYQGTVVVSYQVEARQKSGKVRNDEEHGVRRVEKNVMKAVLAANPIDSTTSGVVA